MADPFSENAPGLTSPGVRHFAITPNDDDDLAIVPRAIYVGGAGNIAMHDEDGNAETWTAVAAGTLLPFRPTRVLATDTTATLLIGVY